MFYRSFPAVDALLQKVVRWKKHEQSIRYNSSKIDWHIKVKFSDFPIRS